MKRRSLVSVKQTVFVLFLFYPQLKYLVGNGALAAVGVGGSILFWLVLSGNVSIANRRAELIVITSFAWMLILSVLLFLFGRAGDFPPRNLALHSFMQLSLGVLLIDMRRTDPDLAMVVRALMAFILVETLIVGAQLSYLTTGIGLEPIESDVPAVITGSFGNPNNVSAAIGMAVMAVSVVFYEKRYFLKLYSFLAIGFFVVGVTLSRTVLVFLALFALAYIVSGLLDFRRLKSKQALRFLIPVIVIAVISYPLLQGGELDTSADVINRSVDRSRSIVDSNGDDSAGFRLIAHQRLLQNIFNLGYGSFSDLNYSEFFESGDDSLMKWNPHSFAVEYSFLFGYFGLIAVIALFASLIILILSNKRLPYLIRLLSVGALLFVQAVPSSVLASASFFIPVLFLGLYRGAGVSYKKKLSLDARGHAASVDAGNQKWRM